MAKPRDMKKIALFLLMVSLGYCSKNSPTITADTLATVNARTISKDDFLSQAQSISNTPSVNLRTNDGRIDILKDMINEELVFQQAINEQYHLKNLDVKHEVVREYLKQKFSKDIPDISEDQTKKFYNENQTRLDQINASHILILAGKKDPKSKKAAAQQEAQKIRNEIISGKISFEDAVKKYSQDEGTKKTNGSLGFFDRTKMVPAFAEAAFALQKVGDISPVIKTEFGFHIIKLTASSRGYDTYKEKIKAKLYQDAMKPKIDAYFKELHDKSETKIINADLMKLNVPQL